MGRYESAEASIGIKILLCDLLSQVNETNIEQINDMLQDGFIEDDNDYLNNTYLALLEELTLESKDQLIEKCKDFNKELLVPIKKILSTGRWGYYREGSNGGSRPLDFDLSCDIPNITNYSIVFILKQYAS